MGGEPLWVNELGEQVIERARKKPRGLQKARRRSTQKLGNSLEAEKSWLAAALCCAGS